MDRCVWFIILFVMSHLAHELSGATINEDINKVINDTVVVTPPVHNKVSFNEIKSNAGESNGSGKTLGISPLLDSIFDIPISTLNAVNNFVQRLAGSLKQTTHVVTSRYTRKSSDTTQPRR
ncbi:hypothetical protein ACFFRR_008663 [Megaselia abdita]